MIKYQIIIEYVGTKFVGWQYQRNGTSIQKTIQAVLSKLLKEKIKLHGAGRTDKGVHAIAQSAHFECKKNILNTQKFIYSLNFFLNKKEISIKKLEKKNIGFHARHSAKKRTYIYIIRNNISPSVLNNNREWHIKKKLNIELLKKGSKKLVGTHNFSTFQAANCNSKSPVKTMIEVKIINKNGLLTIKFVSKSFLKSQVRSMVGCLKYLSEKKWSLKKFVKIIESKNRQNCAPLAPPHGLYLKRVTY